ncbi:hypothetical protein JCM31826_17920 [Thermaurantimonas aggregans]|uniref:Uncharacterized protein n=1 Tax=Thermaurantimonas aggregans TaxID=2173829 RepID=A0A401XMS1_9FLAO|nr:hypothetical protein [Thermaurantimonas aggregans]MCX8149395.1 hypothetical protein [Thermaurantimonas aggregans]GCD78310.1 hypothetical protein JCM31826_17920 [Thermaurantimonas aggregans]
MKTTTPNYVKWLRIAFLVLTALSLLELAGATFTEFRFLWGYSFLIVSTLIVLTYALLGRPYFRMDTTSDVMEFENGFSMFDFLDKYLIVKRDKVLHMAIEDRLLKRVLVVQYEELGEVQEMEFEISFLSEKQVIEIKKDIERIKGNKVLSDYNAVV